MVKWRCEGFVEVHHHLGDAAFSRRNSPLVGAESKMLANRGLHALPIQHFTFDCRGIQSLIADKLDLEDIPIRWSDVLQRTNELAGAKEKLLLQFLQSVPFECEIPASRAVPSSIS